MEKFGERGYGVNAGKENRVNGPTLPRARFKAGGVQVAVWDNVSKEGQLFQTVSIDRSYKAGDEWKTTKTFRSNDLPKMILALEKAYEYLALRHDEFQGAPIMSPTEKGKGLVKLLA